MKSKRGKLSSWLILHRLWVQLSFLVLWLIPIGSRLHGVCGPVFHCYACPLSTFACPVGLLAQFGALHVFPFVAVGILVLLGSIFGTLICGWACPFGLVQDLAGKVPTPKFDPPKWAHYFRYVMLAGTVLAVPYFFGEGHPLFVCRVCPAGVLEAGVPGVIQQAVTGNPIVWPNAVKLTVLGVFIVAILFVRRPWCRIFCPLGAIFSLFNRASAFILRLDKEKCTECLRCHQLCKYGVEPDKGPAALNCIRCLECTKCGPRALTFDNIFTAGESTGKSTVDAATEAIAD